MISLSEDPKYGFAIGRVRALEPTLLDRPRYDRFVRARTADEFVAALGESPYGRFLESGANHVASALDRAAKENADFLSAYALDAWLLRFFSVQDAFRALKSATKIALTRGDANVTVSRELEPDQPLVSNTLSAIIDAFSRQPDPGAVDSALDKLMQRIQLRAAVESGFLTGYLELHADHENLRTLVRLKAGANKEPAGEMATAFLEGGELTLAHLLTALSQSWEAAIDLLGKATPYGVGSEKFRDYLEQGRTAAGERRSFVRMERLGREQELRYLRQTRYATFGHEPLAAYFLMRENELRNLRLLYSARLAGLTAEETAELVAYVD